MARVFIACPTHDGRLDAGAAKSLYATAARTHQTSVAVYQSSLLNAGMNALWATALNAHERGECDWFAVLHADVTPDDWWLDTLTEQAEAHGADLLSAVVAMKDARGLTSTALSDPANHWQPWARLTLTEVLDPAFPATFGAADVRAAGWFSPRWPAGAKLLVNTGCCVVRLRRWWPEQRVWFETKDRLARGPAGLEAQVQSEDWWFSLALARAGGVVMATTAVRTVHRGPKGYATDRPWGRPADDELAAARAAGGPA